MCREFEVCECRADASSPSRARRFVVGSLRAELPTPAAEGSVELTAVVASELVTNAVRAGCGAVGISLQVHRDHLRVIVFDDAPGRPERRMAGTRDVHGRGLAIVSAVSRAWGIQDAANGKPVWAVIALPEEVRPASACLL